MEKKKKKKIAIQYVGRAGSALADSYYLIKEWISGWYQVLDGYIK